jgi:uncharacterized protein YdaU (DUF1376 family)
MKWYKRDPDAWLAATRCLTLEERGAYNDILEMLYSRDGHLADDDALIARNLGCRPQVWRRLKARLIAAGKLHQTEGKLTANRVETTLKEAANLSESQKIKAGLRWKREQKQQADDAKPAMPLTTTTTTKEKKEEDTANAVSKYAFESGVIRLTQKDLDRWKGVYRHLDVEAELTQLTEWAGQQQSRWFNAVSGALNKRNRDFRARIENGKSNFKSMTNIDGVI